MITYTHHNGQLQKHVDVQVNANDLSVLRGYGIFDYFVVRGGVPLFVEDYLQRFVRSAEAMHLPLEYDQHALHQQVLELIEANGQPEAGIRLVLTGGYAEDGYSPVQPQLYILQYPFPRKPQAYFTEGVKLLTHPYQRALPEIKTTNYTMGIYLLPRLRAAAALEPLYYQDGKISESARSNIFLVQADGSLLTPDAGILYGITRKKVLEIAKARGLPVATRPVSMQEMKSARELFLTGSTKKVMPVVQVDEMVYSDSRPGPVTRQIMQDFEQTCQAYVRDRAVIRS